MTGVINPIFIFGQDFTEDCCQILKIPHPQPAAASSSYIPKSIPNMMLGMCTVPVDTRDSRQSGLTFKLWERNRRLEMEFLVTAYIHFQSFLTDLQLEHLIVWEQ